jgi:hypothetical protein
MSHFLNLYTNRIPGSESVLLKLMSIFSLSTISSIFKFLEYQNFFPMLRAFFLHLLFDVFGTCCLPQFVHNSDPILRKGATIIIRARTSYYVSEGACMLVCCSCEEACEAAGSSKQNISNTIDDGTRGVTTLLTYSLENTSSRKNNPYSSGPEHRTLQQLSGPVNTS